MDQPRVLLTATLALGVLAGVAPAVAQVAAPGRVGQVLDPGQGVQLRAGTPVSGALPTLEDESKADDARRKALDRARATASAGNPIVNANTKAQVQKQVRRAYKLTRPPNKAVLVPTATGSITNPGMQPAAIISPGLSEPVLMKKKKTAEEDPYAPLGLRMGGFKVLPAIEASVGYDTNPLRGSSGTTYKGSKLYQVTPELSVQSDWSRHSLQLDLRGTYSEYPDVKNANRPTVDGKLTFRGDVGRDSTLNLELKEKIDSQRPGSVDLSNAVKGRPLYYVTSGSAGWTEKFGRAAITGTALVDRYDYQDATTTGGSTLSQKDRNYTALGAKLRGAYEITPGIMPFVEVSADTREYDNRYDVNGYQRTSQGLTAKAGTTVELTRTLTGEVSGGWGTRAYEDKRLANLTGPVIDASLVWQISPLTKATLKAGTEFIETVQVGSSGALSRKASLELSHDLLRNLTITGSAGFAKASYQGINRIEDTITAGLKADYKIDRNFVLRTSYGYERALVNLTGQSYLSHTFLMGLRIQR